MTTTLTDKQLQDAYWRATIYETPGYHHEGLRAVADLAITQADSEIHGLTAEIDRLRLALTEAQRN